ncbi:sulfur carrier protein ThiS [Desulfopila sp. IMCC35008]|uniref:sulfur carrier protein ThiS n=1 Tax=Desulfopila sp. IMCC35008 TaxID=2653858 RepID=UPI0013D5B041|nr:sulfur carrier protein ThiS [Desulfopila sp. IMCC35008]
MQIQINGKAENVDAHNLAELIIELGVSPQSLVIECNKKIIRQDQWAATTLAEDDRLELLNFVGGG